MIKDWVEDLLTLNDEDWCQYTFNRDPLVGRITSTQESEFCQKARNCGVEQANRLHDAYGDNSPSHLIKQIGLNLLLKRGESALFACFEEPNTITVYLDNADATDQLIAKESLSEWIGNIHTADLLIAHELYHYLEYSLPDIYTTQKLISLWKIGPFENRSRILCLQELGAMAFAKELVGLNCSAYLFDVLMLFPRNPQKAKELYDNIMGFRAKGKEPI